MTHEQKPESAEFRTSAADNKEMCIKRAARDAARRTREEQIRELIISFEEYEHTPVSMPGYAHKMILEAEIRAVAAEQRRKDAEGAEPVKWQRDNPGNGWIDTPVEDLPFYKERGFPIRPLYLRPANVAALEARVKELEGGERMVVTHNRDASASCGNLAH